MLSLKVLYEHHLTGQAILLSEQEEMIDVFARLSYVGGFQSETKEFYKAAKNLNLIPTDIVEAFEDVEKNPEKFKETARKPSY